MNTSFLLGTSPMYPKARNMKIPAKMQIRLFICISLFWPMMVANSLIESAVITQNKTPRRKAGVYYDSAYWSLIIVCTSLSINSAVFSL